MSSENNESKKPEIIELEEKRAIINLPENTVDVEIVCKVYYDGDIIKVGKSLRLSEIQAAFLDAENNYISDDDKFVVTEKGIESIKGLDKND